ncbi:copper chaperone PCu(A)C [Hyphomicrobium methylovorum]|uniref:copper chaperone PCu(A)C n=1 Tax=Hyphomicrobium methylovorum TaxID=84 RepID=UPI0015E7379A|nr:copper chaperone PCu(A)C [Hyphomicrobium methylovorum]MBA2126404.1 copper chaperone PCu(A)C [Hyphomicrobium methylovorum]
MRALVLAFGLLLAVPAAASAHEVSSKGVTISHPWVRATPTGANVGAAFLEIKTDASTSDRLTSASSPAAERVEIHTHIMDNGVMKMRRLEGLDIAAGSSHMLKPMGDHIMLFNLKQPLKEGDSVDLTLNFEKAGPVSVKATVEPMGAMGPHGFKGQPGSGDTAQHTHDH